MKKIILFIFISKTFFALGQQTVVLDKKGNLPIPFAHFVSTKGSLIATSNLEGIALFKEQINNDTIVVQHLSYQKFKASIESLKTIDTIFLEKKVHLLQEVVITPDNDRPVLVLKGYFRSYETDDDVPKFYTDGMVEYYIKGNKVKMKLLNCRAYENEELIKKEKIRNFMVVVRLASVPRIDGNPIRDVIKTKKYTTQNISTDIVEIRKDSSVVGIIKHESHLGKITLNIDFIKPNKSKTRSLFNYTGSMLSHVVTEVYSSDMAIENILKIKKYREILFKHKRDAKFVKLQGIDEFFVLDKFYVSKKQFKKIKSSSYEFPESSSYEYEYWNNLKELNIPELNENIDRSIKESLILRTGVSTNRWIE